MHLHNIISTSNNFGETPLNRIEPETLECFMGEFCIQTDDFDCDPDDNDDLESLNMDESINDPAFSTNIRQSPLTFNYHCLSPYNKGRGISHTADKRRVDVFEEEEIQVACQV